MFERIARWFTRSKSATLPAKRAEEPVKPTERVGIDCAEVQRLRAAGVSWRKISRLLPGAPAQSTIRYQFEQWLSRQRSEPRPDPAPALPAKPVEPPVSPAKVPEAFGTALAGLRVPGAAARSTEPSYEQPAEEPVPEFGWWGQLSDGERNRLLLKQDAYEVIFLVLGEQDARIGWNCQQPVVCVTDGEWRPGYERHPVIAAAQRIYAVLRPLDPNAPRLLAALSLSPIRGRVLVCTSGEAPLDVFRYRLGLQRQMPRDHEIVSVLFEQSERFVPLPEPGRVGDVLPKPEPPERVLPLERYTPSWMLPQQPSPFDRH